jgi:hypothetical protein
MIELTGRRGKGDGWRWAGAILDLVSHLSFAKCAEQIESDRIIVSQAAS